jgi:hypothetical protein
MGILVIVGVLGMILGQFFKCFVFFPACGLAIVLVLASPAHMDNSLLGSFLQFVVLTISLQIGYAVGAILALHRSVRRTSASTVSTRPRQVAVRAVSAAKERHNLPDGGAFEASEN